jgi:hypothetical protein
MEKFGRMQEKTPPDETARKHRGLRRVRAGISYVLKVSSKFKESTPLFYRRGVQPFCEVPNRSFAGHPASGSGV